MGVLKCNCEVSFWTAGALATAAGCHDYFYVLKIFKKIINFIIYFKIIYFFMFTDFFTG
jgi:hypothetical protein